MKCLRSGAGINGESFENKKDKIKKRKQKYKIRYMFYITPKNKLQMYQNSSIQE